MKFVFTDKKVNLPRKVHAYAEKKVGKLDRYFKADTEAAIVFSVEKDRNNVELTIRSGSTVIRVAESTSDMFATIDAAVASVERRLRRKKREVELVTIQTRYPLGMEKQLIRAVTGREVSPGQSALDVGCAVFNVATVYAIRHALLTGEPLTHRAVTVSGGAVARPRNLWVPIGTPLRCLLQAVGGLREEAAITLTGGPMNGMIQENLDAPVVKNTNALLCLTAQEHNVNQPEMVCVKCGHCVSACPMDLNPVLVYRAMRLGEKELLDNLHLEDCMDCGCCSYICPSHIPLMDLMRQAKKEGASHD